MKYSKPDLYVITKEPPRDRARLLATAVLLIVLLCIGICCHAESVTEIPLGDGLPVWMLDGAHISAELPEHAGEQGLIGIYTTDTDSADVYVYSFPREHDLSLEDFGQRLAAERSIFCNMLTDRGVPAAVLNYCDCIEGEHYIVQAYIYETDESFIEVCTMFKTESVSLGNGDYSIHMIREYVAQEQSESTLLFDTVYLIENDRLPQLHILQFPKDDFPAEIIEPELRRAVSDEQYASLAADGWTPGEFVSLYAAGYDLLKGEVTCRNGLDHAFIGYIDGGVFKTRAFIVDGDDYILMCAEAEAARFQHVTNALIDAVEKN